MPDVNSRVQKHRDALRRSGLRPIQIWVPDTRLPNFEAECRQQSQKVAKADYSDTEVQKLMDDALSDIDGWTE